MVIHRARVETGKHYDQKSLLTMLPAVTKLFTIQYAIITR